MGDGTDIGIATLMGRVRNKSDEWLWVLYDKGGVVRAKYLAPGWMSPDDVDADALKPWREGMTIGGSTNWWKLPSCVTATVQNNRYSSGLWTHGLPPGLMSLTKESDWGNIQYDYEDERWGRKMKWWE